MEYNIYILTRTRLILFISVSSIYLFDIIYSTLPTVIIYLPKIKMAFLPFNFVYNKIQTCLL